METTPFLEKSMRIMRRIFYVLLSIIGVCVLYVGGVIMLGQFTDYQPDPIESVSYSSSSSPTVLEKDTFQLMIWNIGYGGLGAESDFFYDGGQMVRSSSNQVQTYLEGIFEHISSTASQMDFILLQEVDRSSKRSYHNDEVVGLSKSLPDFGFAFAKNYDVRFIPIPFFTPMGKVTSGLTTFSPHVPTQSQRFAYEGNYDFPNNLFFLDRCFLLMRYTLANGKELCVINTHNSAYDDGSLKAQQMNQLKAVILAEYEKGNYVVVGGDWNQYPPNFKGFSTAPPEETDPALFVSDDYPSTGWTWAFDPSIPTNRSLSAPLNDTTEKKILDFYLLSPNVSLIQAVGTDLNFHSSDHQPVTLQIRLDSIIGPDL